MSNLRILKTTDKDFLMSNKKLLDSLGTSINSNNNGNNPNNIGIKNMHNLRQNNKSNSSRKFKMNNINNSNTIFGSTKIKGSLSVNKNFQQNPTNKDSMANLAGMTNKNINNYLAVSVFNKLGQNIIVNPATMNNNNNNNSFASNSNNNAINNLNDQIKFSNKKVFPNKNIKNITSNNIGNNSLLYNKFMNDLNNNGVNNNSILSNNNNNNNNNLNRNIKKKRDVIDCSTTSFNIINKTTDTVSSTGEITTKSNITNNTKMIPINSLEFSTDSEIIFKNVEIFQLFFELETVIDNKSQTSLILKNLGKLFSTNEGKSNNSIFNPTINCYGKEYYETFECFINKSKTYVKSVKFLIVFFIFMKFIHNDFNYENNINSHLKRIVNSFNDYFLIIYDYLNSLRSEFFNGHIDQSKQVAEFISKITKFHKSVKTSWTSSNKGLSDLSTLSKYVDVINNNLKQFSK